jgi:hypothetical protein
VEDMEDGPKYDFKIIPEHHRQVLLELMSRRTSAQTDLKKYKTELNSLEGKINET